MYFQNRTDKIIILTVQISALSQQIFNIKKNSKGPILTKDELYSINQLKVKREELRDERIRYTINLAVCGDEFLARPTGHGQVMIS